MTTLLDEKPAISAKRSSREEAATTYVTFDLAGQTFGVDVRYVREILDRINMTLIPNAPSEIEGMIDIRGESIPIMDLSSRLGLRRIDESADTRIIVFELRRSTGSWAVGVLAEQVRDVTEVAASQIETPPALGARGHQSGNLSGLARHNGELILLLDISKVFPDDDEPSGLMF